MPSRMNNPSPLHPTVLASAARRALLLLGTLLLASTLAACVEPTRQRKNVKDLTAQEKQDFVDAVLKLKATPSPHDINLSWYDQFVEFHRQIYYYRPGYAGYQIGHESPTFLPWHRKFLLMYEQALREVSGKDIVLPYWDWTDAASTDAVFSNDFMGSGGDPTQGYAVVQGPFRLDTWKVHVLPKDGTTTYLVRGNLDDKSPLPKKADIDTCLALEVYDAPTWDKDAGIETGSDGGTSTYSFRSCLEGWTHGHTPHDTPYDHASDGLMPDAGGQPNHAHNSAHIWVGGIIKMEDGGEIIGSMAAVDTSPNDPAFFLHHANVDRLWAEWQESHPDAYLPGDGREGWNAPDSLYPFNQYPDDPRVKSGGNTVGDMLDVRALGYEYVGNENHTGHTRVE
jgi:tyrosinase